MDSRPTPGFAKTSMVLCAFALVIAGILSPPDPFTLILYAVPLVLLTLVVSYGLTYGGGYDYVNTNR